MNRYKLPLIPYLAMVLGLYALESAWASFVIYHGLVLAVLLGQKDRPHWRSLRAGWDPGLGLGAILFGLTGGVTLYLLAPLAKVDAALLAPALDRLGLHGTSWFFFVVYHALVNPWFEEVFWRGKLGDESSRPVFTDALFAGYHVLVLVLFLDWPWVVLSFVILTAAGWLWRQLRARCRGLLVPVISHMAADASIMAVAFVLSR